MERAQDTGGIMATSDTSSRRTYCNISTAELGMISAETACWDIVRKQPNFLGVLLLAALPSSTMQRHFQKIVCTEKRLYISPCHTYNRKKYTLTPLTPAPPRSSFHQLIRRKRHTEYLFGQLFKKTSFHIGLFLFLWVCWTNFDQSLNENVLFDIWIKYFEK